MPNGLQSRFWIAIRNAWDPPAHVTPSEARASGVLLAISATGATFLYVGLIWSTPLSQVASEALFELFLLPAMVGVCVAARGGYRTVAGTGVRGSSALASVGRITLTLASLLFALTMVIALFVAARGLRRERTGSAPDRPPAESFGPGLLP